MKLFFNNDNVNDNFLFSVEEFNDAVLDRIYFILYCLTNEQIDSESRTVRGELGDACHTLAISPDGKKSPLQQLVELSAHAKLIRLFVCMRMCRVVESIKSKTILESASELVRAKCATDEAAVAYTREGSAQLLKNNLNVEYLNQLFRYQMVVPREQLPTPSSGGTLPERFWFESPLTSINNNKHFFAVLAENRVQTHPSTACIVSAEQFKYFGMRELLPPPPRIQTAVTWTCKKACDSPLYVLLSVNLSANPAVKYSGGGDAANATADKAAPKSQQKSIKARLVLPPHRRDELLDVCSSYHAACTQLVQTGYDTSFFAVSDAASIHFPAGLWNKMRGQDAWDSTLETDGSVTLDNVEAFGSLFPHVGGEDAFLAQLYTPADKRFSDMWSALPERSSFPSASDLLPIDASTFENCWLLDTFYNEASMIQNPIDWDKLDKLHTYHLDNLTNALRPYGEKVKSIGLEAALLELAQDEKVREVARKSFKCDVLYQEKKHHKKWFETLKGQTSVLCLARCFIKGFYSLPRINVTDLYPIAFDSPVADKRRILETKGELESFLYDYNANAVAPNKKQKF